MSLFETSTIDVTAVSEILYLHVVRWEFGFASQLPMFYVHSTLFLFTFHIQSRFHLANDYTHNLEVFTIPKNIDIL